MPPEVGYADTSSDIVKPMIRMKTPRIGQDHEIEIGPPLLKPAPKLVKQPARIEMIENEIAKLENPDHERFSSWLYPSLARCFSSSLHLLEISHRIPPCATWMRTDRRLDPQGFVVQRRHRKLV